MDFPPSLACAYWNGPSIAICNNILPALYQQGGDFSVTHEHVRDVTCGS